MRALVPLILSLALLAPSPHSTSAQHLSRPSPAKSTQLGVAVGLSSLFVPLSMVATGSENAGLAALYAWIVGPFPGLVYAGDTARGLRGMGLRAGLLGSVVLLTSVSFSDGEQSSAPAVLAVGAALGTLVSWGADIAAIPDIVGRRNRLQFSPTMGSRGEPGVQMSLRW